MSDLGCLTTPGHIPVLSPEPPLPRWLVALRVPTALRTSPGMLFPASSSLHRALLRGREFTRARPPRRPMLFQRRSGRTPAVTRRSAPGQSRPSPGCFLWGQVLPAGALLTGNLPTTPSCPFASGGQKQQQGKAAAGKLREQRLGPRTAGLAEKASAGWPHPAAGGWCCRSGPRPAPLHPCG